MENQIKLVQKPIIEHRFIEVGNQVDARLEEANIKNLVYTDESLKSYKELRAGFNKECAELKSQFKDSISPVADVVTELKALFKLHVLDKYAEADALLKDGTGKVEMKRKQDKEEKVKSYFTELCLDADIDFVKFSDVGLKINLSTSLKAYKEKCVEFVDKVNDDIQLISTEEFQAEIMTEYKSTLKASTAITNVRTRKQKEKEEADRIQLQRTQRRESKLRGLNMVSNSLTKTFNSVLNDSICIDQSDIENLSDDDFSKKFVALEADIKAATPAPAEKPTSEPTKPTNEPIKPKAAPLKAPTVVKTPTQEKLYKMKFECNSDLDQAKWLMELLTSCKDVSLTFWFDCSATMTQAKALAAFMKENNITFKDL